MEKFLKFLLSKEAVLLATIMSLATQLWHSVQAFIALEPGQVGWWTYLFGVLFSVSTSFAILIFTVRGKVKLAYFSLAVEVFINIIHYGVMDMQSGPILYSTLFMCIITPVYISLYSAQIPEKEVQPEGNVVPTPSEPWHQNNGDKYVPAIDPHYNFKDGEPKGKAFIIDKSQYNGQPNIEMVTKNGDNLKGRIEWTDEGKQKAEFVPIGMDDDSFIKEINNLIGFDITNPDDKSGKVPEAQKAELRKLWSQRKNKPGNLIKSEIQSILKQNGKPLFN